MLVPRLLSRELIVTVLERVRLCRIPLISNHSTVKCVGILLQTVYGVFDPVELSLRSRGGNIDCLADGLKLLIIVWLLTQLIGLLFEPNGKINMKLVQPRFVVDTIEKNQSICQQTNTFFARAA